MGNFVWWATSEAMKAPQLVRTGMPILDFIKCLGSREDNECVYKGVMLVLMSSVLEYKVRKNKTTT